MDIAGRKVGREHPPLVVVELGINHGGSLRCAKELVDAAFISGAEVVKHQTHIPDQEMSVEAKSVMPGNADRSIYEVIASASLSLSEERELAAYVRSKGMLYLSTPFSFAAVDFLEELEVPAFKIGSGECNNYPFVEYVARRGKPVILSTGMNSIETIRPAVEIMRRCGVPYALLHCTNLYPTPARLVRLEAIKEVGAAFPDAVLGLSDHSVTNYPSLAAVALGASILERHFTDSRERTGPDIVCSMTPDELKELIHGSRIIHEASGSGKRLLEEERVTAAFAFASVVATRKLRKGERIDADSITLKRPGGGGFGPKDFEALIGSLVIEDVEENHQLSRSSVESR
jgi:N-acetylneuraminate synthase